MTAAPTDRQAETDVLAYIHSLRLRRERTYARGAWSGLAPYPLNQLRLELGIASRRAHEITSTVQRILAQVTTPDPVGGLDMCMYRNRGCDGSWCLKQREDGYACNH